MAARYLVGERSSISLQATALVNELCLRLLGWDPVRWQNRGHFFGVSAQMMRRVLVDIARRRRADRRGGPNAVRVPLDAVDVPASEPGADLLAVDAGAPDARAGGPAQGPGRGASLLWRPLHRRDRGGARHIGAHGSHGLGIRAGVAVPNADGGPCPLTAGSASKRSSGRRWSSPPACVRISSPARVAPMPACGTRSRRCWPPRSDRATSSPPLRSTSSRGRSPARGGASSPAIGSASYTVERRLGAGGMGEVWRARDERLGRDVAIKLLLPHPSNAADRVRALQDEARAAGALNHTNVLTVYDVGDHDGAPYLVTECLEGESLRARLRTRRTLGGRGARRRAPGRPGARRGARTRHRASRPEAGEHLPRRSTAA